MIRLAIQAILEARQRAAVGLAAEPLQVRRPHLLVEERLRRMRHQRAEGIRLGPPAEVEEEEMTAMLSISSTEP